MNVEIYLFGDFGNGYTQYIDDSSHTLFKSVAAKSKANSQLVIHRDDTLMYYIYVRRLHNTESSNNRYIGICYVINNRFVRNIEGLFVIFESAITTIASRGHLLGYTNSGNIAASVDKIYNAKSEFTHISAYLKTEWETLMADQNDTLPPMDYSISTSEVQTFHFTDNKQDMLQASLTYSTIYIFKDRDYENEESKAYAATLFRLNKENLHLKETNARLSKQKKNMRVVTILSACIAVGVILFLLTIQSKNDDIGNLAKSNAQLTTHVKGLQKDSCRLVADLQSAKNKLHVSNGRLNSLRADSTQFVRRLDSCYTAISALRVEMEKAIKEERAKNAKAKSEFNALKNSIAPQPFYVYDIEMGNRYGGSDKMETDYGGRIYSSHSMYLVPKIKYIGITSGTYLLKMKLYKPDGTLSKGDSSSDDCTYARSVSLSTGNSETIIGGWGGKTKGFWRSGSYRIEIWYDSTCLFSKTFTIY